MIVEHAERFGLSQLHQLRGRVGRGAEKSFCMLLASDKQTEVARERLGIMEERMMVLRSRKRIWSCAVREKSWARGRPACPNFAWPIWCVT